MLGAVAIGEEAIVPDPHEALGEQTAQPTMVALSTFAACTVQRKSDRLLKIPMR